MNGLAAGGGAVAINEVSILAGSLFPSLQATPIMTGVVQIGVGAFAAMEGKNGWLMYAGIGAFAVGVANLLKSAGVIGAAPQTMAYDFQNRKMMGDPRLQFVAGPTSRIGSFPNNFPMVAGPGRKKRYTS